MRILSSRSLHAIALCAIGAAVFLTIVNIKTREEVRSLRGREQGLQVELSDLKEQVMLSSAGDSVEGSKIPAIPMYAERKGYISSVELFDRADFSIVISDPFSDCSSCLDVTLQTWLSERKRFAGLGEPPLLIVAAEEGERALKMAGIVGLNHNCYVDSTAQMHTLLGVPKEQSVAMLVDRDGNVVYCTALRWKFPQNFSRFLTRTRRYISCHRASHNRIPGSIPQNLVHGR